MPEELAKTNGTKGGNGRARKPGKLEASLRYQEVADMLMSGMGRPHIIRYCRDKWGIGEAAVDKYLTKARGFLAAAISEHREEMVAESFAQLQAISLSAREKGDHQSAVAAIREKNKLLGLHAPERHEYSHSIVQAKASQASSRLFGDVDDVEAPALPEPVIDGSD